MQRSPPSHPRPHHQRSSPSMSTHPHHPSHQQQGPPPGYPYPPQTHPSIAHYQHSPVASLPPQQPPHPHLSASQGQQQQQHGPPPSAPSAPTHTSSRGLPSMPPYANGGFPSQQHSPVPPPSSGHPASLPPSSRHAPPPAPVLNSGSVNGNNLLQGPPPGQRLPHAGQGGESATVAQILRDGEGGLREEIADRKPLHPVLERLAKETEMTWVAAGSTAEAMGNVDRAAQCYEAALKHNPCCVEALGLVATLYRRKEDFRRAAEYFSRLLSIKQNDPNSGETWGALGHCYLMLDDLQKAYTSYQQAVNTMNTPKHEPKLWYGIGILYDRYGSLEHAEEAFSMVIKMDPEFEKANEIYFRLGIIYKQQQKHDTSLACFRYILRNPPPPLTEIDIWFQVGHVYEQMGECDQAKNAYQRVLEDNPTHAKVLQQLGGLYCRQSASFYNPEQSVEILTKSLETDPQDAASWYLLGRAYMTMQNYGKAYESYQQAVYRDGKNPAFWCSIGVLYYAISQYRDSLDAYSRAIRINPYIPEVWYNLGALYESCNDQLSDAVDAYQRAIQLDDSNLHVQRRLNEIQQSQQTGRPLGRPPSPKDMSAGAASWHFNQGIGGPPDQHFGAPAGPPGGMHGPGGPSSPSPPPGLPSGRTQSAEGMNNGRPSTATVRPGSSGLHQGVPAPVYSIAPAHERRQSSGHGALAPMDVERSPHSGRLTTVGALNAPHHNLPHIGQVYDRRPSRGPSPSPNQVPPPLPSLRGESSAGRRNGHGSVRESQPQHSPKLGRTPGPPFVDERVPSHPHSHPGHTQPPQHAVPAPLPHQHAYNQRGYPMHEEAPLPPRNSGGHAWRGASPPERGGRTSPHDSGYAQPTMMRDYPAGYPAPIPQHQSPYDPRHQSPGIHPRGALATMSTHSRYPPDQRMESPGPAAWTERGYSSHMPPGDDRRPGSQNGPPPSQHAPPRWDPKQEGPLIQRPKQPPPQISTSRRPVDEDERRPSSFQAGPPVHTLLSAQPNRASPTPSVAASEVSAGGGTKKSRTKVKDEEYTPSSGGRKRKAPPKVPEGAPKEKKERKKPSNSKVRGKKGPSNADAAQPRASPSPNRATQPASFVPPTAQAAPQIPLNPPGPSTLQQRRVDEDYDVEEDEEGASSLLHLAGLGASVYQPDPHKSTQAPTERNAVASLQRQSRASPALGGQIDNGTGAAPLSATFHPSPPGATSVSNRVSQSPTEVAHSPDAPLSATRSGTNSAVRKASTHEGAASNGHQRSRSRDRVVNGGLVVPRASTNSPNSQSKMGSSALSSASVSGPADEVVDDGVASGTEEQGGGDGAATKKMSVVRGRSEDRESLSGGEELEQSVEIQSEVSNGNESGRNAMNAEEEEEAEEDQMEE